MSPGPFPDMVLGVDSAPVTIVLYTSLDCAHCGRFHAETFDKLKKQYIDTGKARFVLREFPYTPAAAYGAALARCSPSTPAAASTTAQYYETVSLIFKNGVKPGAKAAGFTDATIKACVQDQKMADNMEKVRDRPMQAFGINSTPTIIINGDVYRNPMTFEVLARIIEKHA